MVHKKVVAYGRWSSTGKKLAGLALLKLDLLCHLSEDFVTIIHDHAGWRLPEKESLRISRISGQKVIAVG